MTAGDATARTRIGTPSDAPLHVVHFILDPRVGGPHVYVATVASALAGQVRSVLATPGRGPMTNAALVNLRRVARFLYPLEVAVNAVLIALRWGVAGRPSLFHVHGAANLAPLVAAWVCRMPVVFHFHETVASQRILAEIGGWFVRRTRHVVMTVSRAGGIAFGRPDSELVPGAVDAAFWDPDLEPSPLPTTNASLKLVSVGNLNPLKGHDVLLAALERLERPVELKVIGLFLKTQASYAAQLEKQVATLARRCPLHQVTFLGGRSPHDIRCELAKADVFVLSSRSEACPIALLEAMAMRRPCVATDVGAVREMLPAIQQTLICRPDDPDDLARSLADVAGRPIDERLRIGAANRVRIEAQHAPGPLARQVLAGYRRLLSTVGTSHGRP